MTSSVYTGLAASQYQVYRLSLKVRQKRKLHFGRIDLSGGISQVPSGNLGGTAAAVVAATRIARKVFMLTVPQTMRER